MTSLTQAGVPLDRLGGQHWCSALRESDLKLTGECCSETTEDWRGHIQTILFVDGLYKDFLNIMPNSTEQFDHIDFRMVEIKEVIMFLNNFCFKYSLL